MTLESRVAWGTYRAALLLISLGLGLGLMQAGLTYLAVLGPGGGQGSVFSRLVPPQDLPTVLMTLMGLAFVWGVLTLAGYLLTPSVPSESGGSFWACLSVMSAVGAAALYVFCLGIAVRQSHPVPGKELAEALAQAARKPDADSGLIAVSPENVRPFLLPGDAADDNLVIGLACAFLGLVALAKAAFILSLWNVARYFRASVTSWSILLFLMTLVAASAFVITSLGGKPLVLEDSPRDLALITGSLLTFGSALFAVWMLFNVLAVRAAVTEALLRPGA
jgi:hypothetical protein